MSSASAAAPTPSPERIERHRPFGILVLASLFLLRAAMLAIALAAPALPDLGLATRIMRMPLEIATRVRGDPVAMGIVVALILGLVLSAMLMWGGRRTGWRLGILTTGFFLLIDLVEASRGDMHTLWMALDVVTVFYLNQREVREYFAVGSERSTT